MLTLRLCYSFTEQLTKDSAKIKANIRMVLEVSLFSGGGFACMKFKLKTFHYLLETEEILIRYR